MTTLEIINSLTEELVMDAHDIEDVFDIVENSADGNCFFESLSQLLYNKSPRKHKEIRQNICKFYRTFDTNLASHVEDSIEYRLAMLIIGDRFDTPEIGATGDEHTIAICKNRIYASLGDVYVASIFYKCDIIVFIQRDDEYSIQPCKNVNSTKPTLYIRLIDDEHYEAMFPKKTSTKTSETSSSKSTTAKKRGRPKKESPKKETPKSTTAKKRGRPKKESPKKETPKKRGRPKKESPKSTTAKKRAHIIEDRTKALKIYKLIHDDVVPADLDEFNSWYESDYPDIQNEFLD